MLTFSDNFREHEIQDSITRKKKWSSCHYLCHKINAGVSYEIHYKNSLKVSTTIASKIVRICDNEILKIVLTFLSKNPNQIQLKTLKQ